MQGDEFEADVSIGTEIPEHEQVDEYQTEDILLDSNQNDAGKAQLLLIYLLFTSQ